MQRLLRVSHTRSVLSSLADTINLPPGWNTTPRTQLSWPANRNRHIPVLTSHTYIHNNNNHNIIHTQIEQLSLHHILTRIVLSREPDARNGPGCAPFLLSAPAASLMCAYAESGAQAIHSTTWSWSRSSVLHSLLAVTHTRTVWSLEQDAISDPSGEARTIRTHSLCPANVFTQ